MMYLSLLWILMTLCAISQVLGHGRAERKFPENFLLGASTSSYQIEGAWNVGGKGESTWDYHVHNQPDMVEDLTNGDIAADSYHLYEKDVEILKHLGAKSYRFSISWTRILPNGTTDCVNPVGIAYYRRLIDLLLANDILPIVTIYHWDLPIAFGNQGGLMNEEFVDWVGEYARVVFRAFGGKVKHWISINEIYMHCYSSYEIGNHAPLMTYSGIGAYECGRNYLLGHARIYHIYDKEFRGIQGGQVGLTLDAEWPMAASDSEDDIEAAEDYLAFRLRQYLDPIFKGDYPARLVERVANASAQQGLNSSRLRPLSEEQKAELRGATDFVGINHYNSLYAYRNESVIGMYDVPSFNDDTGYAEYMDPSWPISSFPAMSEYAPGFYALLMYLKDTYDNPIVYITENGFPLAADAGLNDNEKANYIKNYLDALLDAMEAGCNVQGYFFWSLLDTFEWSGGYQHRFGLYQIDLEDPERKRTARKSALVYKEIIRTGTVDFDYDPDPYEEPAIFGITN